MRGLRPRPPLDANFSDTWESFCGRLPPGWSADLLVLDLNYTSVPTFLWSAPVPVVALAPDWTFLWHAHRRATRHADLVLTDGPGVEAFRRQGIDQVRQAVLFGPGRSTLETNAPDGPRDIDVLFVGNLHPAVQKDRLPWLARLARLSDRFRVAIAGGVFGDEYRALLSRARVVFNRSSRGECNMRCFEAACSGALLFAERGNAEVASFFEDRTDCVCYGDDDLESLLEHYLSREEERLALAQSARRKVNAYGFEILWDGILREVEAEWDALRGRAARRTPPLGDAALLLRAWQAAGAGGTADPTLADDLRAALPTSSRPALLHNALGVVTALVGHRGGAFSSADAGRALPHFQQALAAEPGFAVAALNLAEGLAGVGRDDLAVQAASRGLELLDGGHGLDAEALDACHFPPAFDPFRVEWERAAWANPGDPEGERTAKGTLLRWRLHSLLAELTDDLAHFTAAAGLRPDLPATRAALGCALARAGRQSEAVGHLREAVGGNPLDLPAARALYQALRDTRDTAGADAFAADRRLLSRAAPAAVPPEPWFAPAAVTERAGVAVVWEGEFDALHSLSLVNRALCLRLAARGHHVSLKPLDSHHATGVPRLPAHPLLADRTRRSLPRPAEVHVRHGWPPDFRPPAQGRWVLVQPWEFGRIPRHWVAPITEQVDEVWAYTEHVRRCYLDSGVPADKVRVVPLGLDATLFRPGVPPLPLRTDKKFKFLFVGGTIPRKGIDVLLDAYATAFNDGDDVCLLVKDMGVGTFYKGQTAQERIGELQRTPGTHQILYVD